MKITALVLALIAFCALTGCSGNKVEKAELNKGENEVVRTEDALYEAAGENPFQSDFREKQKELLGKIDAGNIENPLKTEDLTEGTGPAVKEGDTVTVQYKGTLKDGTEFDSSYKHGKPFGFTVGKGSVIRGWDEGLIGMKAGGKRKLTVPPDYGYGDQELPGIPANSTLIFEIELLKIE